MYAASPIKKSLQMVLIDDYRLSMTFLIAMQKVVGSNPISRFTRKPALERAFVVQAPQTGNQTIPSYRLHFGH
jgi:hypothetical protein